MHPHAELDHRFVWHPFTQMREWLRQEPIVIASGEGAVLRDVRGREYLDANASIWTNLHGHNHPQINAAIQRQLRRVAHSSALGLANGPAALLAQKLVEAARWPGVREIPVEIEDRQSFPPGSSTSDSPASTVDSNGLNESFTFGQFPPDGGNSGMADARGQLNKVFFSDDGSTAVEVALKLAYEFARRTSRSRRPRFLSLQGAYHGDTIGAVSLGHIDLFHRAYAGMLFKSDPVMAPYCYRCPFNRARPERADAREYRRCRWECLDKVEQRFSARKKAGESYAAFVVEPLMQGAAGMIPQPAGWLRRVAEMARAHRALLIADEVMTGFGRTGSQPSTFHTQPPGSLFACHHEGVQPDFLALAKGLTGGYLPMAATLTTQEIFDAFLGEPEEFKTFFHGHSYTANQLGSAAALASLKILASPRSRRQRASLESILREELACLWELPAVGDLRQVGLIVGVELVQDWRSRRPFPASERMGARVCAAMARRGVLTRPIGDVVVLMPPYCTTRAQIRRMVTALRDAIRESVEPRRSS